MNNAKIGSSPRYMKKTMTLLAVAAAVLLASSGFASTNVFNFDSDPSGILTVFRNGDNATLTSMAGVWFSSNGSTLEGGVVDQSTNGYFAITQTTSDPSFTAHGMRSAIVFDDFDAGLVVAGFTFSCDVRIGAGSDTPADGFSLNYARADDPVIVNADGSGFATGPGSAGANAYEEGTQTGLAISFDVFANTAGDNVGLTLNIDGVLVTNIAITNLNGSCTDSSSLQTGPNTGGLAGLCWQPLFVQLTTNGRLNVSYKNTPFLTNFPVAFAPGPGRLIFAGRTGGLWEEQDVDNIRIITIPSPTPVVTQPFTANANGFKVFITDSGSSTPDANTITLKLDGASVTPTSISKNGAVTTVVYQNTSLVLASGSSHTGIVHFTGSSFSGSVDITNTFTVPAYTMLTPAHAAPAAVNTSLSGFAGRIHGLSVARAGTLNSVERQLANGYIDPSTGQPYVSYTSLTNFTDGVINWGQDVAIGGADVGNFRGNAAPPADWP